MSVRHGVLDPLEPEGQGVRAGLLDVDSAIGHFVDSGVVPIDAFLSGEVWAESRPRRNRNIVITGDRLDGLFVKQPEPLASASVDTLRSEGAFYLEVASSRSRIGKLVPRLLSFDPSIPRLVFELLKSHQTLSEVCRWSASSEYPIRVWRDVGERVAFIHLESRAMRRNLTLHSFPPWPASLATPAPDMLATLSPAGAKILEIVQSSPSMTAGLEQVPHLWTEKTIVHGDLRGENILVRDPGANVDLRFVDWEMAQFGDPMWDVASLLEVLITWFVWGVYAREGDIVDSTSSMPWAVFQACCRSLWDGYWSVQPSSSRSGSIGKATIFAAMRSLQTSIELTMDAEFLPPFVLMLLQAAENLLARPALAGREFLGLA